MSVNVSPVSKTASLLIVAIGFFMLAVGWSSGSLEDSVAGTAFIVLGLLMYRLLFVLGGRAEPGVR
jgi:hypothetical protein